MPAALLLLFALPLPLQDPLEGQLPKNDLGVAAFLEAHPDYDGRAIRVAILDTGIDPGHPLLQKTSQGGRKIVDWYDATTDGRIETSREAEAENGTLIGLSGRRLRLGRWDRPGRHFHLGRIDAGFLPGDLKKRILDDRRRNWLQAKRKHEEQGVALASDGHETREPDPLEEEREEVWKHFDDPGPVYDLVVFQDGEGWRVVVDNDEDGDLGEETALRPFPASGDWATLGEEALLHYGVRIEEDGRRVILLFDAHGHGTHVAGIVGGWDGKGSRFNGIAPGVELVAIKIGDGKFGGATSGFSIARAIDQALEAGCQVANISFGGSSFFADGHEPDARILEEAARRGLIVCTSAGNEGPALTTVGAPATSAGAWAVAAAVWPDTERVSYGSLDPSGPVLFDFSSRGPLPGGGAGISFTAPGAAVSSLPSWRMTYAENWNGTSMASPQMAGCVALMLSAARQEDLPASPARLKRAFRIGARPIPGFAFVEQGFGAPRLLPTLGALKRLAARGTGETGFDVEVDNPFGRGAEIYERGPLPAGPFERSVRVQPRLDE
ncbi:MAG: S8 family serine peptidase, partial [Planctomycetota bacterium]